jgi:hypothetical protein
MWSRAHGVEDWRGAAGGRGLGSRGRRRALLLRGGEAGREQQQGGGEEGTQGHTGASVLGRAPHFAA